MFFKKIGLGIKEWLRKTMVSIKRGPKVIPMLFLVVSFLYYSFNLTAISDTTVNTQGFLLGQCAFIAFLFSMLAFVTLLNAFPKREKTKIPMLVIFFVLLACVVVADIFYSIKVAELIVKDPRYLEEAYAYIPKARLISIVHAILVGITMILVALLPLYSKLLQKIKTSIDIEGSDVGAIELESDE